MYTPPLPAQPKLVDIRFKEARYDVPGRSMRMTFDVTNMGDKPLRLGEFATASIRFVNQNLPAAKAGVAPDYPQEIVARTGLAISDDNEIKPGERRTLKIDATDAAWEIERLTSFLTDVDSKFGGLLFFYDAQGNRYIAEVGGPILPVFKKSA
jgi:methane/ammonia monooxygenase subunit B